MVNDVKEKDGRTISGQKSSEGGRGDPEKASPAAVERYIKGTEFPADKNALIKQAESNNAPSDVLNVMKRLEDKEYHSPIDIAKALGNMNKG